MGSTDAAARPRLTEVAPQTEPPILEWRPHTRSRRNRAARDRLCFGFRPDKPGKRLGFTDSTGEYRDTRTGWLRSQSRANPSLALIPCLSGKIQGILRLRPRFHYPMDHKTPTILRRPWENSLLGGTGNFSCLTGTQIRPTAKFGRRIREEHGPLRRNALRPPQSRGACGRPGSRRPRPPQ